MYSAITTNCEHDKEIHRPLRARNLSARRAKRCAPPPRPRSGTAGNARRAEEPLPGDRSSMQPRLGRRTGQSAQAPPHRYIYSVPASRLSRRWRIARLMSRRGWWVSVTSCAQERVSRWVRLWWWLIRTPMQEACRVSAGGVEPWPHLDDDVTRGQFGATPIARVEHFGMSTAVAVPVQQERAVGRHVLVAPGT